MSLSPKKFVDIDIRHHVSKGVNSIRDKAALLSTETDITLANLVANYNNYYHLTGDDALDSADFANINAFQLQYAVSSIDEFNNLYNVYNGGTTVVNFATTKKYVDVFFNNGGNKLIILTSISDVDYPTVVNSLANELIVVAYTGTQSVVKTTAQAREQSSTVYGINRKLLLMSVSVATDTDIVEDAIYKYSANPEDVMSIAAYLTNINIYGTDSIHMYSFTAEQSSTIVDDDTLFDTLSNNDINFDVYLSGAVRAYGGNTKSGKDLVNEFVLIVMQQTVTDAVITALTDKLKNEQGLSSIKTVMSNELAKYVTNGYLNTSAIWTDPDYTVSYNNETYTVVEQNTALPLGYRIKILPYSSLTPEDRQARKTPPIYLAVSDSYGIKKVTINGKVF